jgi:NAD(P)-dependent dehydrogenase (short-subunit alcohol dehydrogenase family)
VSSAEKVVLITGALSDIGRATARAFAGAGYVVVLNHHRTSSPMQIFDNATNKTYPLQRLENLETLP